jgi:hypothetical protein
MLICHTRSQLSIHVGINRIRVRVHIQNRRYPYSRYHDKEVGCGVRGAYRLMYSKSCCGPYNS